MFTMDETAMEKIKDKCDVPVTPTEETRLKN